MDEIAFQIECRHPIADFLDCLRRGSMDGRTHLFQFFLHTFGAGGDVFVNGFSIIGFHNFSL